MSPGLTLRSSTLFVAGLAVIAIVAILLVVGRGLGLRWDPFGLGARRQAAVERQAEVATADAKARGLEVEGAAAQIRRLEQHHQQAVGLARVTAAAGAQARSAHDSDVPLDASRVARLRDHDRELCRLAPAVCGPAPAGASAGRADALSAGPAAGGRDPG